MDIVLSRLAAIENKYSVNEARLSGNEIYQDPTLWAQVAKEQKELEKAAQNVQTTNTLNGASTALPTDSPYENWSN